jgi:hypothetical protein
LPLILLLPLPGGRPFKMCCATASNQTIAQKQ